MLCCPGVVLDHRLDNPPDRGGQGVNQLHEGEQGRGAVGEGGLQLQEEPHGGIHLHYVIHHSFEAITGVRSSRVEDEEPDCQGQPARMVERPTLLSLQIAGYLAYLDSLDIPEI